MLYKFKSKATADLIMLEANGKQILRIIGKEPALKGIVEVAEMPEAIEALRRAVQQEEDALAQVKSQKALDANDAKSAATDREQPVSLKQRATPFIDMLQRAHKAGKDLVWGA